jgi:tetratricopeptide (TPR) repeat protein
VLSVSGQGAIPTRVDLEQTPFFPQVEYQCGPSALATVLSASGLPVTPADLVPEVYLPGRQGSLQPELLASARRRDRLPYQLPPTSDAIIAQLADRIPVLVLQKLGAGPWPGWHYAVVVGYDVESQVFLLRSGTERRLEVPAARFLATWDRADRWAVVVLQPGQMPGTADLSRYIEAAAALEAVGRIDAAGIAYRAAAMQWPRDALPRLALGNVALTRGDFAAAESEYRQAIELDRGNVAAHNNLAEVLLRRRCVSAARSELEIAKELAGTGPLAAAVADTAARVLASGNSDEQGCPAP